MSSAAQNVVFTAAAHSSPIVATLQPSSSLLPRVKRDKKLALWTTLKSSSSERFSFAPIFPLLPGGRGRDCTHGETLLFLWGLPRVAVTIRKTSNSTSLKERRRVSNMVLSPPPLAPVQNVLSRTSVDSFSELLRRQLVQVYVN